jgi:hypothetical protein
MAITVRSMTMSTVKSQESRVKSPNEAKNEKSNRKPTTTLCARTSRFPAKLSTVQTVIALGTMTRRRLPDRRTPNSAGAHPTTFATADERDGDEDEDPDQRGAGFWRILGACFVGDGAGQKTGSGFLCCTGEVCMEPGGRG